MPRVKSLAAVIMAVIIMAVVAVPLISSMGQLTEPGYDGANEAPADAQKFSFGKYIPTDFQLTAICDEDVGSPTIDGHELTETVVCFTSSGVITIDNLAITVHTADTEENLVAEFDGSITISSGSWTFVGDEESGTVTRAFLWAYYPDPDGGYAAMQPPAKADIASSVLVYSEGEDQTNPGFLVYSTAAYGKLDSLALISGDPDNDAFTATYDLEDNGVVADVSAVSESHPVSGSETMIIVPLEFVAHKATTTSALVYLVMVVLAASLVIGIAYRFLIARGE